MVIAALRRVNSLKGCSAPMQQHTWGLVHFPKFESGRGSLTVIDTKEQIPFEIGRVFYIYDVPEGAERGGHAHKCSHEVVVPVAGSFHVEVTDGCVRQTFFLDRADVGLYLPPLCWREIRHFTDGAICLALASGVYDVSEYLQTFDDFLKAKGGAKS